jgi:hypothetical protein
VESGEIVVCGSEGTTYAPGSCRARSHAGGRENLARGMGQRHEHVALACQEGSVGVVAPPDSAQVIDGTVVGIRGAQRGGVPGHRGARVEATDCDHMNA